MADISSLMNTPDTSGGQAEGGVTPTAADNIQTANQDIPIPLDGQNDQAKAASTVSPHIFAYQTIPCPNICTSKHFWVHVCARPGPELWSVQGLVQ